MVGGFLKLSESQGIPLQEILYHALEAGWIPDWTGWLDEALALGWNASTALSKAEEALTDVMGKDHCREVMFRMRAHLATRAARAL